MKSARPRQRNDPDFLHEDRSCWKSFTLPPCTSSQITCCSRSKEKPRAMVPLYPEFFNDVFGPVMQPGSSSHMAGPCRLGYLTACLLGEPPRSVQFTLDPEGSYAGTFGLMNEDLGLLAGTLGILPDDRRLFEARELACARGIEYRFVFQKIPESTHPNAVGISLRGVSGSEATLVGDSTGGGMIEIKAVNGFPVSFKGDTHVVLVFGEGDLEAIRADLDEVVEEGAVEAHGQRLHYFKTSALPRVEAIGRAVKAPRGPGWRCSRRCFPW